MEKDQSDMAKRARRATTIDSIPVIALGSAALALGSDPDQSSNAATLWLALGAAFALSLVWVLFRAFRRSDEYQRKIQLESMAVAFGAVLVGIHVCSLLDAADIGELRQHVQIVFIGSILLWLLLVDLRTRLQR